MAESRLIHGDCMEVMARLSGGCVDMVLADLPYGVTDCEWDNVLPHADVMGELFRVTKNNGAIVLTATQPFASDLISAGRKYFRYDLIWQKSYPAGFLNANKMPLRTHESVLVFYKKLPTYNPQKVLARRVRSSKIRQCGDRSGNVYSGSVAVKIDWHDDGTRHPGSVIKTRGKIANCPGFNHPTQKPVELFEWLIRTYTNSGEVVLDPTAGSGTTAIAAMRNWRKYICIERDATYFAGMSSRIHNEQRDGHQPSLPLLQ